MACVDLSTLVFLSIKEILKYYFLQVSTSPHSQVLSIFRYVRDQSVQKIKKSEYFSPFLSSVDAVRAFDTVFDSVFYLFVKNYLTRIIQFVYISVETLSLRKSGQSSEFGANGESAPIMLRTHQTKNSCKGVILLRFLLQIVPIFL